MWPGGTEIKKPPTTSSTKKDTTRRSNSISEDILLYFGSVNNGTSKEGAEELDKFEAKSECKSGNNNQFLSVGKKGENEERSDGEDELKLNDFAAGNRKRRGKQVQGFDAKNSQGLNQVKFQVGVSQVVDVQKFKIIGLGDIGHEIVEKVEISAQKAFGEDAPEHE